VEPINGWGDITHDSIGVVKGNMSLNI